MIDGYWCRLFKTFFGTTLKNFQLLVQVGEVCKNRLRRRFKTTVVHQKITTDTTEFKYYEEDEKGVVRQQKAYLNPFMDLYNLEILSYRVSKKPTFEPIKESLDEAIESKRVITKSEQI